MGVYKIGFAALRRFLRHGTAQALSEAGRSAVNQTRPKAWLYPVFVGTEEPPSRALSQIPRAVLLLPAHSQEPEN